jgi:hypothetical protein
MLADSLRDHIQTGTLDGDVHMPSTSMHAVLDFIAAQLPVWRDRSERRAVDAEELLTAQLCAHLNGAARRSSWDFLQFKIEDPDSQRLSRRIDLVIAPCGVVVWAQGRRHTEFDALLPVECKRLPTPGASNRDEREYVIHRTRSTGGIQRFKLGLHGADYSLGGMIGYVQQSEPAFWFSSVRQWIDDLVTTSTPGWSQADQLREDVSMDASGLTRYRSTHVRVGGLSPIELVHLWLKM